MDPQRYRLGLEDMMCVSSVVFTPDRVIDEQDDSKDERPFNVIEGAHWVHPNACLSVGG